MENRKIILSVKYLGIIKPDTKVLHMYKMLIAFVLRMKENKILYSILFYF
jgi:hypothetical protein